jgi:hypothetical protein
MVALSSSGTANEAALGVSGDGSIVVGYTDRFGSGTVPFRWTGAAGLGQMASVTGATATQALAISKGGTTVLGTTYNGVDNTGDVGIVWSGSAAGQVLNLSIGYLDTQAVTVTSDGSIVYGFYQAYAGPGIPFKWTPSAGAVNLVQSTINIWGVAGVSGDGNILIGNGGSDGFVWDLTNGPPHLLADILVAEGVNLGGMILYPYAISDDGNVIVGRASTGVGSTSSAFLARWR